MHEIFSVELGSVCQCQSDLAREMHFAAEPLLKELEKKITGTFKFVESLKTPENSSLYRGYLLNGKRHGPGIETSIDGTTYSGEWRAGVRHGNGILSRVDGYKYEG